MLKEEKKKAEFARKIFDEYCNYVYIIVMNKIKECGTKEDAEECVSDVFAEIYYAEEDTQNYCCGRKDEPHLFQPLDDFLMRENEIPQKEHSTVQPETIYDYDRRIADFS